MQILECKHLFLFPVDCGTRKQSDKINLSFIFFPFLRLNFNLAFNFSSCIDSCIRTKYSTVRVDIGHGTGFKDPLELLKNTQNKHLIWWTRVQFFSNLQGVKATIGENSSIWKEQQRARKKAKKAKGIFCVNIMSCKWNSNGGSNSEQFLQNKNSNQIAVSSQYIVLWSPLSRYFLNYLVGIATKNLLQLYVSRLKFSVNISLRTLKKKQTCSFVLWLYYWPCSGA